MEYVRMAVIVSMAILRNKDSGQGRRLQCSHRTASHGLPQGTGLGAGAPAGGDHSDETPRADDVDQHGPEAGNELYGVQRYQSARSRE